MRFLTSSESSCRSDRWCRRSRCWLISSAAAFPVCRAPLRLSLRAHGRLLRRRSGRSAEPPPTVCPPPPVPAREPQGPCASRVSSWCSTLTETWDWPGRRGEGPGEEGDPGTGREIGDGGGAGTGWEGCRAEDGVTHGAAGVTGRRTVTVPGGSSAQGRQCLPLQLGRGCRATAPNHSAVPTAGSRAVSDLLVRGAPPSTSLSPACPGFAMGRGGGGTSSVRLSFLILGGRRERGWPCVAQSGCGALGCGDRDGQRGGGGTCQDGSRGTKGRCHGGWGTLGFLSWASVCPSVWGLG